MTGTDTEIEIYRGSCHCGAIRYAVTGHPQFSFVCHCDNCRRLNGGVRMAGAAFGQDQLSTVGKPKTYVYRGGKAEIELSFCETCGTPLFAHPKAHRTVIVRVNSLEDQNAIPPRKSIHSEQACTWDQLL